MSKLREYYRPPIIPVLSIQCIAYLLEWHDSGGNVSRTLLAGVVAGLMMIVNDLIFVRIFINNEIAQEPERRISIIVYTWLSVTATFGVMFWAPIYCFGFPELLMKGGSATFATCMGVIVNNAVTFRIRKRSK